MRKICALFFLLGTVTLGYGQNDFYRSFMPFSSNSVFQNFDNHKLIKDRNQLVLNSMEHFLNWTDLNYFMMTAQGFVLNEQDNFVIKPWAIPEEDEKILRDSIYKDLLLITIDSQLTLKRLVLLNAEFRRQLLEKIYNPSFIDTSSNTSQLNLYNLFSFTGKGGLIELFIDSQYYNQQFPLHTVESPYIPNAYDKLVIEARDLDIQPALFPKLYSYDESGNLILIYAFDMSDKKGIIEHGYAHYVNDEKKLIATKTFYTAALSNKNEDIVISREAYLKFFVSAESITKLRQGGLYIVVNTPPPL